MNSNLKIALASIIGSCLECYDFVLYGIFAPLLANLFFPSYRPDAALLAALGVFAAGYIARPLGSILFGHLGDRLGRKKALTLSIFFMAIPTFIIGILPTYETLGIAAPLLLIICRLFQGLGVSGEYNGAIIFLIEHLGSKRAGLSSAMVSGGGSIGAFVAALVGSLSVLPSLPTWFWRVPFILGGLLAFVGFYIRRNLSETPAFKKEVQEASAILPLPIRTAILRYPLSILCCIAGAVFAGSISTTYITYTNIYLTKVVNLATHHSMLFNSFGILLYICLAPFAGIFSDKLGYLKTMRIGGLAVLIFIYPIFALFQTASTPYIFLGQALLVAFAGLFIIPLNAFMTQLFPTNARYSGVSFSYNVGIALMGGTMPIISTYLIQRTGNTMMPAFYLMASSLIGLFVTWGGSQLMRREKDPLAFV